MSNSIQGGGVGLSHAPGQLKKAEGKSGEKTAAPAEAPKTQQPSMEEAIQKLDVALQTLAANLKQDSFNGVAAPAGAGGSKLDNPLETISTSTFSEPLGMLAGAGAPAPTVTATPTAAPSPLNVPILNEKGGGGASGGVTQDTRFLAALGGGAASGGVT